MYGEQLTGVTWNLGGRQVEGYIEQVYSVASSDAKNLQHMQSV